MVMTLKALIACVVLLNLPPAVQSATCATGKQATGLRCPSVLSSSCIEGGINGCCEWEPTRTCSAYSCTTGYKLKTTASAIYCASSDCTNAICCEADNTKCGGLNALAAINCAEANHYYDSTNKAGTAATLATKNSGTTCCTAKAVCSASACSAVYKLKTNAASLYCATSTCATTDNAACCEADNTKCGGLNALAAIVCAEANHYYDSANKAGTAATAANKNTGTTCCTAKAVCSASACSAGYKLKANAASLYCATSTCATTDNAACCDPDNTKCGGTAVVTCTYGSTSYYWDSAKAGTTYTTKATDCCSAKGMCSAAYPGSSSTSGSTSGTGATGTTSGSSKIDPPYYGIVAVLIAGLLQCL